MKILMVNKFLYIKGGSETYYFALKSLLTEHGHEVVDFSMKDDRNVPSEYEPYFVNHVEYNGKASLKSQIRMASNIIYSREAVKKLEALIQKTKPDIAHLHIFQHQMSPSILSVFKKYKIPVIYTAHDLKMLCLNYKMLNCTGICEKCKGHRYYNCVKYKCVKNSVAKSMICMIEGYLHRLLKSYDVIDTIITPSRFYYNKFLEFGLSKERVCYIPNFLFASKVDAPVQEKREEDYFFYFGRISEEKGIQTLIKAIGETDYSLKIAGTGPLLDKIQRQIKAEGLENRIELLGFKQGEELELLVKKAKAILLPSEWYENSPYSGIESISQGKVMIGSDLGGIPEVIVNGKNGFLFPAGNVEKLRNCMKKVANMEETDYNQMKARSRELFENKFTDTVHYKELMKVYQEAILSKGIGR